MGNLITLFKTKNKIFLQRRHENTSAWQITKKNYDAFVKNLIAGGKSPETIRKYALAINEFVTRAHIPNIKINPARAKKRKIKQKVEKIAAILQKNEIKINDILKAQIAKIL